VANAGGRKLVIQADDKTTGMTAAEIRTALEGFTQDPDQVLVSVGWGGQIKTMTLNWE
jgi:hypothetical protein